MTVGLNGYQLQAEFLRVGRSAGREPDSMASLSLAHVDWLPALEYAKWERVRRHPCPPMVLDQHAGRFEPSWDLRRGRPYIDGVQVCLGDAGRFPLPLDYFAPAVREAAARLVAAGQLVDGDVCRYRLRAVPSPGSAIRPRGSESALRVDPVLDPLAVRPGSVSRFLERAVIADGQPEHGLPVFVKAEVIQQVRDLTRDAKARETGGVLIGHLRFDRTIPEVFLEVTAQIPAEHAEGERASLTLTPATWAAADTARRARGRQETCLGWWHSHPADQWCAGCPEETPRKCSLSCDFFSSQDRALHRCCFARAFQIALVVTQQGDAILSHAMYGWWQGAIERRTFHVLGHLTDDD